MKIKRFKPITHHGGISRHPLRPYCVYCANMIYGFGIQTGKPHIEYQNFYHILCWFKHFLPNDRK